MILESKKIFFGLSEKKDGQMRVAINGDNQASLKNRAKFFKKLGVDPKMTVACDLVHGKNIALVTKKDAGKIMIATDGLITSDKKLVLTVTAADCLPLYFFDEKTGVIGLAHAGWRGVWQNMPQAMVEKLRAEFKINPKNLKVFIGAHIGSCHFSVNSDLAKEFNRYHKFLQKNRQTVMVDLGGIVRQQLIDCSVLEKNIDSDLTCTYCDQKYFSNRRDKPEIVEAMVAYIGRK
ncbi:MAG: polyphenol oxidase family protein [Candidatus Buchananbacteria bacterium]